MTQHHLMVDIETMDTEPTAAIMSIGACAFDIYDLSCPISNTFEACISLESNQKAGRTISAATVMWWMQQSKEAQESLVKPPIMNLKAALTEFRMWIEGLRPVATHVWAKDPDFDIVTLKNAYSQIGERWPIQYWANRSVRTITELAYPNDDAPNLSTGIAHNALDDAIKQAEMVRLCWHKILYFPRAN